MTKIRIMRSWEKQEEKRLKEFEEKRNNAPFKNWIAPAVQEAIESGNYEYIAKNAVRIYMLDDAEIASLEIEWRTTK